MPLSIFTSLWEPSWQRLIGVLHPQPYGFHKLIIPFSLALHKDSAGCAGTEEWEYSLALCLSWFQLG